MSGRYSLSPPRHSSQQLSEVFYGASTQSQGTREVLRMSIIWDTAPITAGIAFTLNTNIFRGGAASDSGICESCTGNSALEFCA